MAFMKSLFSYETEEKIKPGIIACIVIAIVIVVVVMGLATIYIRKRKRLATIDIGRRNTITETASEGEEGVASLE